MRRCALLLILFLVLFAPLASDAEDFLTAHVFLWQSFAVVDGQITWAPPPEAPEPPVIAYDFWRVLEFLMPISAPLQSFTLPLHGADLGMVLTLRVPYVPTHTVVCEAHIPLTPEVESILQTLGCVTRTEAENQALIDEARTAVERHNAFLDAQETRKEYRCLAGSQCP